MLQITDLTLRIAGRPLIEGATLTLPEGSKSGFVGRNGAGKTTLFRAIAGEISPDAGSISLPKGARIGRVEQEAPGGPQTLIETVLAADRERAALLHEADHASDPHRIAELHARLSDIDAHSAEARAGRILAGLGFDAKCAGRGPARIFPAAGACAWRSRHCSSPSPTCFSSTSRRTTSISKARCGWSVFSRAIRAPWSSSATTATS